MRAFLLVIAAALAAFGVTLAGGDTAQSPGGILADIIVVGAIPKGKAVLRSGARVGDRIFVSGELGGSAAAVLQMTNRKKKVTAHDYPRHFYPEPRIELGRMLREKSLASAMIDTSDGLSTDLSHLCEESGVGAEVDASRIPRARVGKAERQVDLDLALHGGEDYELLFTLRWSSVNRDRQDHPLPENLSSYRPPSGSRTQASRLGALPKLGQRTVLLTVYGYLRHQSVSTIERKSGLQ